MSSLADVYVSVRPDTRGFSRKLSSDLGRVDASGAGRRAGATFSSGFGSSIKRVGGLAVTAFAAAGVGAAGFAVKTQASFEKTMSVLAAQAQVPKTQMAELSKLAMKMGADTVFSANDAAAAMLELSKGGLSAAEIQAGALKGTLALASAGELKLGEAATYAANGMNMFALSAKDVPSIADALAGAANASTASVQSLGLGLSQVGPGARNAGLDLNDTVGVLAAFDQAGIKGSDAGTSLKTMLARLEPMTNKASEAMAELGLKFTDAKGSFLPIRDVAEQLKRRMSGLSEAQRTTAMNTIFGSDATRAATVLMGAGAAGVDKYTQATEKRGSAQKLADAAMGGTAGALERMKGAVETAALSFGTLLAPAVVAGANTLGAAASGISAAIEHIKVGFSGGLGEVTGWGATFTQLGRGLSAFVMGFKASFTGLASVDTGGLADKLTGWLTRVDWVALGTRVGNALNSVKAGFAAVGPFLARIGPQLSTMRDSLASSDAPTKLWSASLAIATPIVRFLAGHIDTVVKYLPLLVAGFVAWKVAQTANNAVGRNSAVGLALTTTATFAQAFANRSLASAINNSTLAIQRQTMAGRLAAVWSGICRGAALAWAGAQRVLNAVLRMNPIGLVITGLVLLGAGLVLAYRKSETFRNVVNGAFAAVKAVVLGVVTWFRTAVPAAWSAVQAATSRVFGAIRAYISVVFTAYKTIITTAVNGIKTVWSTAWGAVQATATTVWTGIRSAVQSGLDGVKAVFSSVVGGIKAVWAGLKAAVGAPITFVVETVLNKGLIKAINTVTGFLKLDKLKIPDLPVPRFNTGGPIPGHSPNKRADNVPIMATADEHMWSVDEVAGAGGHKGVERLRAAARTGGLDLAWGGAVQRLGVGGDVRGLNPEFMSRLVAWGSGEHKNINVGSGYRSPSEQARLYAAYVARGRTHPVTAPPGRSNHELGLAADLVTPRRGSGAGRAVGDYGLWWPISSEDWHVQPTGLTTSGAQSGSSGAAGARRNHIGEAWSAVVSFARDKVADVYDVAVKGAAALLDKLPGLGSAGTIGGMIKGSVLAPMKGVGDFLRGKAKAQDEAAGGGGTGAAPTGKNVQDVWNNLLARGFTAIQAAGVMGNMKHESGFDPYIIQGGGHSMNPAAAGGGGYGLVQWTPGRKLNPYLNGQPPTIANQIGALVAQLAGRGPSPEGRAGAALRAARTIQAASTAFELKYERHAGPPQPVRARTAQAIYNTYSTVADNGAWLRSGDSAVNLSRRPERVLSPDQTAAFEQWLRRPAEGAGGPPVTVKVYLGTREITDIVGVELDGRDATLSDALAYGRS